MSSLRRQIIVVAAVSLAGCGDTPSRPSAIEPDAAIRAEHDPQVRVAVVNAVIAAREAQRGPADFYCVGFTTTVARWTPSSCATLPSPVVSEDPPRSILGAVRSSARVHPASECFRDESYPRLYRHREEGSRHGVLVEAGAVTWLSPVETRVEGSDRAGMLDASGATQAVVLQQAGWHVQAGMAACPWAS
jgi:hypothetical protein